MRFTLIKDIKEDKTMSLILKGFLVFILLFLIADILVMNSSFGISIQKINITLFGNEDEYIDPITKASFLEFWHTQIFFIMMILLSLSAIFIRVAKRSRVIIINILMISAIISLIALPISFYVTSVFITIYATTYFLWHITAMWMILYSYWKLNAKNI